ncbi:hypothetical protein [Panacagrimonas sp.]|uniref:hypothetical protein n=1 Tax=Panacagrimonas sp. TaxID=2480088 RepID=UPI003B52F679
MMMKTTRFAALILMASATVSANPPPRDAPPSVAAYLDQVAAIEKPGPRTSLEPVYNAALAAQNDLMTITKDQAWIEYLSDAEFADLRSRLKGFVLSRGLDIFADPDPKFFRALAEKRGEPADLAFFTLMEKSIAPDYLPIYVKPQGRGVCVRYGEDLIAPYYASWLEYQRQSPGRYKDKVTESLANVEDAISLGTCACGEIQSVQHELSGFLNRFPTAPVNNKIRDRIEQLDKDPWKLPVRCT